MLCEKRDDGNICNIIKYVEKKNLKGVDKLEIKKSIWSNVLFILVKSSKL